MSWWVFESILFGNIPSYQNPQYGNNQQAYPQNQKYQQNLENLKSRWSP